MDEGPHDGLEPRPAQTRPLGPESEPELEPPRTPLHERPFWRAAFTVTVVLLILLALWWFPSEYWRF